MRLDDDSGFDLTEAGTQRKLAIYVVSDPESIPHVATLGPDPLAPDFDTAALGALLLRSGRAQLKGVLKDQRNIAGIGNAYSDEILHLAKMSPFKPASSLTEAELVTSVRRHPGRTGWGDRAGQRVGGRRPEGGEEVGHAGARPNGTALPGLRRHRGRGLVRRFVAAVLPDLPDRGQEAGRPPAVASAEIAGASGKPVFAPVVGEPGLFQRRVAAPSRIDWRENGSE